MVIVNQIVMVAQSIPEIPGLRGSQFVIVHVIRDPNYVPLHSLCAVITAAALLSVICYLSVALKGVIWKNLFCRFDRMIWNLELHLWKYNFTLPFYSVKARRRLTEGIAIVIRG